MVVIGGIGTLEGPVIGVLINFGLRELLADFGTWYSYCWAGPPSL
jgi:branched-chain amino acid transport system permease protein